MKNDTKHTPPARLKPARLTTAPLKAAYLTPVSHAPSLITTADPLMTASQTTESRLAVGEGRDNYFIYVAQATAGSNISVGSIAPRCRFRKFLFTIVSCLSLSCCSKRG